MPGLPVGGHNRPAAPPQTLGVCGGREDLCMTPRDRVLNALVGRPARPMPWIEHAMNRSVVMAGFGLGSAPRFAPESSPVERHLAVLELDKRINKATGCCNLEIPSGYTMAPRIRDPDTYAGLLTDRASLSKLVMPDLTPRLWDDLQRLIDTKDDYAIHVCISSGIGHVWQTMDMTAFAVACAEDHDLLREILARYTDWTCRVLRKVQTMGVDFVWCFDDFAYKTGCIYSPTILREVVLPYARQVAAEIKLPWIFHSDGNLTDVLDDLVPLGMNALNPIEHGCMDVAMLRRRYPDLTLIGNVDVGLLSRGTPEQVRQFVRDMFRAFDHGHRYIPSSGNSIPHYTQPENARAMIDQIAECAGWDRTRCC